MAEEGFHDYTLATNLERLVAQLEQCIRGWMLTGDRNILNSSQTAVIVAPQRFKLSKSGLEHISHMPPAIGADKHPSNIVKISNNIKHRLPWREQPYILTLHVPYTREADLQAARQQQQQQQRQQQQHLQRQQQQALLSQHYPPAPDTASTAAIAAAQVPFARAVKGATQQDQLVASAGQKPSDAVAEAAAAAVTDLLAAAAADGDSNEQLEQRVQDLIEEYRQLHLQLQEDENTEQQEERKDPADAAVPVDTGHLLLAAAGDTQRKTPDAAAAETQVLQLPANAAASGKGGQSLSADAAVDTQAPQKPRISIPALQHLIKSGSTAAAAGGEAPSESEESEEAISRQVDLPAPEELVLPNSTVLAAVHAAVRQDQSRSAVSKTWWPHCFISGSNSSGDKNLGLEIKPDHDPIRVLKQQKADDLLKMNRSQTIAGRSSPPAAAAAVDQAKEPYQTIPSLKAPWWSPVASIHKLQRWFGLDLFVLLQPASYSRRLLDTAEASSLLSVGRLALSSSGVMWPLLLPVHDALRDAYTGAAQVGGSSVYFTTDSIHISRLPRHLTVPQQQIAVFSDQLAPYNAAAAAACMAAVGQTAASSSRGYSVWMSACCTIKLPNVSEMHWLQQQTITAVGDPSQQQQRVGHQISSQSSSSRSSFSGDGPVRHPSAPLHDPYPAGSRNLRIEDEDLDGYDWDADSAWHPWAQQKDPIKAIELDLIWEDHQISDSAAGSTSKVPDHPDQAAIDRQRQRQTFPPPGGVITVGSVVDLLSDVSAADHWLLHVVSHGYSSTPIRQGRLGTRSATRHRRHVSLAAAGADWLWTAELALQVLTEGGRLSGVCPQPYGYNPGSSSSKLQAGPALDPGSFTTMLSALMTARTAAAAADSLWELTGSDWWESRGESAVPPLPPESVFDSVLRDLFSPPRTHGSLHQRNAAAAGSSDSSSRRGSRAESSDAASSWSHPQQQQQWYDQTSSVAACNSADDLPRCAPAGSLLCRLALHALVFGNARAIAALWQRFVAKVRLQFWEQRTLLPYMPAAEQQQQQPCTPGSIGPPERSQITRSASSNVSGGPPAPDLTCCLLHQKLQMLNVCIWRRDKRLSRGLSQQQQQQQQGTSMMGGDLDYGGINDSSPAAAAGSSDAGSEAGGSSSSIKRSLTAVSSSFFSAADEDDESAAAATADEEEEVDSQQQEQGASNGFEDARSELDNFNGSSISSSNNTHETSPFAIQQPQQHQQQQAEGVAGVVPGEFLLNFPDQPLRIPIVQDDPMFTEDQIIERQTALMQLAEATAAAEAGSSSSSNRLLEASAGVGATEDNATAAAAAAAANADLLLVRQRLLAAPLLSDMSAFKAANPGCCLKDFLRWYAPKDWQQQQQQQQQQRQRQHQQSPDVSADLRAAPTLSSPAPAAAAAGAGEMSSRMTQSGPGSWQQLWDLAPPLPAAAQRPLLNPSKEGEQVLHYLETLTPAALFSQLLAAAVKEALRLLMASRGAALPAAEAVAARFRSMAAAVLKKGGGIAEALAAAAAPQQQQLAGDWQGAESGLSDIELELLLAEFHYVEQVVVLGESLLHHLPGQRDLASRLLANLVQGIGSSSSSSSSDLSQPDHDDDQYADDQVLGQGGFLPVARMNNAEKLALVRWVGAAATAAAANTSARRQQQQRSSASHTTDQWAGGRTSLLAAAAAATDDTEYADASAAEVSGSSSSSSWQQQVHELQHHLGEPAQREWVLTCAPTHQQPAADSSSSVKRDIRLKGAVAAAVAAATGAADSAAAAAPVPPSRMYLQEADGEMRMAFTLVSGKSV